MAISATRSHVVRRAERLIYGLATVAIAAADRDVRRREGQPRRHGTVEDDARDPFVRRTLAMTASRPFATSHAAANPAQQQQLRQAGAPTEHTNHHDDRHRRERTQLHDADERRARRIGQLIDQPEEVDLRRGSDRSTHGDCRPDKKHETDREA